VLRKTEKTIFVPTYPALVYTFTFVYICVLFAGLFYSDHPRLCYVEMVAAFQFRDGNITFMTNQMVILKMIASAENSRLWLECWEIK
jgi:hypothetical protein